MDEPETILPPPAEEDERPSSQKQHRASISGRKMTGRPPITHTSSSSSLAYQMSNFSLRPDSTDSLSPDASTKQGPDLKPVLSQVVDWLVAEKSKQFKRKMRHPHWNKRHDPVTVGGDVYTDRSKRDATEDDSDLALDKLEGILSGFMRSPWISTPKLTPKSPMLLARKGSIARILKRPSIPDLSSGTDWHGDEFLVPNVEADLDNTKTMSYTGGVTDADTSEKAKKKDRKHWVKFKEDILRLTHTLQLRGWRRVLMEEADEIDVARLSGKSEADTPGQVLTRSRSLDECCLRGETTETKAHFRRCRREWSSEEATKGITPPNLRTSSRASHRPKGGTGHPSSAVPEKHRTSYVGHLFQRSI